MDMQTPTQPGASALLLHDVARLLRADARSVWHDGDRTGVVVEDDGDLDSLIAREVERNGLCATVLLRSLSDAARNLPGPVFRGAELVVEVCERSTVNRAPGGAAVGALAAAEQAARTLHQARCVGGRILLVERIRRYPQPPEGCDGCWHVELSTGEINLLTIGNQEP